ncbi:MAG: lysylphosphatidylglycerol synthase transmembrane domain-containing protein [Anaerolineales bacterium]
MEEKSNTILRRLIPGLLFGFLVFLVLILIGDLRQVSNQVLGFQWKYYPLVLLLTLFNYLLRFFKWHFYLGLVGVKNYPLIQSARLFLAGFPLAVTPGKVGEALKGVWLQKETGVPTSRGISVVLAERISDGLGVLLLSTLGVIAYPRYWPAFAVVLSGLIILILIIQTRPAALWLLDLGGKLPLIKRFSGGLREFYEGSYTLFRLKAIFIAVSLGTISWLGEGIGMYLVLLGLGVAPGWTTLSIAVFVLAFSTVVGAVSALPGGLGAAEASIAGMLTLLLALNRDTAAAATLLIRFATLWFAVFLGLAVWGFSRKLLFGAADE